MFYLYDINTYHRNYGSLHASEKHNKDALWHPSSQPSSWNEDDDEDDDDNNNNNDDEEDENDNHGNYEYHNDVYEHNNKNHHRQHHHRRKRRNGHHHHPEERLLNIDEAVQSLGMGVFQYRIGLAAGMLLAADSIEVVLLSFLSNVFRKSLGDAYYYPFFSSTTLEDGSMSSDTIMNLIVVPAGVMGALVWGIMGDWIGRRPVFVGAAILTCIFSMATSICTTYPALLVTRLIVGFGIGGLTVPFCTLSEFLPPSQRGTHLIAVQLFCILGALLIHLVLAQAHVEQNWRSIVVWCSIPSLLASLLGLTVVPESPRWLLSQNRSDEALIILKVAAKANGKDPDLLFPDGIMLYSHETQPTRYDSDEPVRCWNLLSPGWIRLTAIMWSTYFGMSFLTHGTISLAVSVFSNDHRQQDYQGIFTAASQFLSLFVLVFLIDGLGRSTTQCLVYALGGFLCLTISLLEDYNVDGHPNVILILTFLAHTCMFGGKCTTWISTTEILSTNLRTTGHGMANSVSRMGGFLSSYVISRISSLPSVGLALFIISLWTASTASKLPETNAKEMGIVWIVPPTASRRRRPQMTSNIPPTSTTNQRSSPVTPPTYIYV